MCDTTGYAGGESELQMVINLPSPADKGSIARRDSWTKNYYTP